MNVGDYVIAARSFKEVYFAANCQIPAETVGVISELRSTGFPLEVRWGEGGVGVGYNFYSEKDMLVLNQYFRDVFSPTEQELGMFEMLFGETIKNNLLKALEEL